MHWTVKVLSRRNVPGRLPAGQLIDLCCSGRFTKEELKKRISGRAGLTAHLGTTDVPAIVQRIEEGDKHAELVLDAMIYHDGQKCRCCRCCCALW